MCVYVSTNCESCGGKNIFMSEFFFESEIIPRTQQLFGTCFLEGPGALFMYLEPQCQPLAPHLPDVSILMAVQYVINQDMFVECLICPGPMLMVQKAQCEHTACLLS